VALQAVVGQDWANLTVEIDLANGWNGQYPIESQSQTNYFKTQVLHASKFQKG